jgi:hypothetical protein
MDAEGGSTFSSEGTAVGIGGVVRGLLNDKLVLGHDRNTRY